MGDFLGDLFGEKTTTKSQSTSQNNYENYSAQHSSATTDTAKEENVATNTSNQVASTGQQQQTGTTNTLDDRSKAILQSLLNDSASGDIFSKATVDSVGNTGALSDSIGKNALSTKDDIMSTFKSLSDQAVQNYQRGTATDISKAQSKYGNGDSSFAQLLQDRGNQELATTISGIGANLALSATQAQTAAEGVALQGAAETNKESSALDTGRVGLSTALASVLKGATSTSDITSLIQNLQQTTGSSTVSDTARTISDSSTSSDAQSHGVSTGINSGISTTQTDPGLGKVVMDLVKSLASSAGGGGG